MPQRRALEAVRRLVPVPAQKPLRAEVVREPKRRPGTGLVR